MISKYIVLIEKIIIITLPMMSVINYFNVFTFNTALSDFLIPVWAILFLLDRLLNKKSICISKWCIYFFMLVGVTVLSGLLNGLNKFMILSESMKWLIDGMYFVIIIDFIQRTGSFKVMYKFWSAGAAVCIVYGLLRQLGALFGIYFDARNVVTSDPVRFIGTLTDANAAAVYLGITFFLSLNHVSLTNSKWGKAIMTLSFICLLLTFSRGGLIAFFTCILLSLPIFWNYYIKNFKEIVLFALVILLIFQVILITDTTLFQKSISYKLLHRVAIAAAGYEEASARPRLAKAAFEMGNDHFFLGVGRGGFVENSSKYLMKTGEDLPGIIPHNTILGLYAETGIVGLIAFLIIFGYVLFRIFVAKNYFWLLPLGLIFIEGLTICIEHFRPMWILVGLVVGSIDFKGNSAFVHKHRKEKIIWIIFAVNIILLVVLSIVIPNIVIDEHYKKSFDVSYGDKIEMGYHLMNVSLDGKPSGKVMIYANRDDKDVLLYNENYKDVSGYGFEKIIVPENVKKITFEWVQDSNGFGILSDLYVQKNSKIASLTNNKKRIIGVEYRKGLRYKSTKLPIENKKYGIKLLGTTYSKSDNGFTLNIFFGGNIEKYKYKVNLISVVDNINNLRYAGNFKFAAEPIHFKKSNGEYVLSVPFKVPPGDYIRYINLYDNYENIIFENVCVGKVSVD